MKLFRKTLWLSVFAGMGAVVAAGLVPDRGESQDKLKALSIISTASGNGELAPCG